MSIEKKEAIVLAGLKCQISHSEGNSYFNISLHIPTSNKGKVAKVLREYFNDPNLKIKWTPHKSVANIFNGRVIRRGTKLWCDKNTNRSKVTLRHDFYGDY